MIEISGEYMSLTVDDRLVATAPFSRHAAGNGNGVWTVSPFRCRSAARHDPPVIAAAYLTIM